MPSRFMNLANLRFNADTAEEATQVHAAAVVEVAVAVQLLRHSKDLSRRTA